MKIPKPRKLPSGNWFIQLRLGGESVPITEPTEKQCIKTARLVKAEYLAGKRERKPASPELTLEKAIDNYIAARSNTLSPATIRGYQVIKKNRFKKVMGKHLSDIADWQAICNDEAKLCSAKTLKNSWMLVASVIKKTTGNAAPNITLPQVIIKEKRFLEPEQIPVFIAALNNRPCKVPALLALHSLRRSEICALTWDDIDLKSNKIFVRGALVPNDKNEYVEKKETKNQASRRCIPIMIPELRAALEKSEDKSGHIVKGDANAIYKQINRVCRSIDLPEIGFHGLRHSFASLAFHLNIPEKMTMRLGGWANHETMRKIYTHLAQKDVEKYETEMADFFKNANKKANA